jgi:molecular chaperone HscA
MSQDGGLLNEAEVSMLQSEIATLERLVAEADYRRIEAGVEQLAKASDFFASRRMDQSISRALSGHTIDEIDKETR